MRPIRNFLADNFDPTFANEPGMMDIQNNHLFQIWLTTRNNTNSTKNSLVRLILGARWTLAEAKVELANTKSDRDYRKSHRALVRLHWEFEQWRSKQIDAWLNEHLEYISQFRGASDRTIKPVALSESAYAKVLQSLGIPVVTEALSREVELP